MHPNDKIDLQQKAEIVYEIPCAGARETGRAFGTRLLEHSNEVQSFYKETIHSFYEDRLNFWTNKKQQSMTT